MVLRGLNVDFRPDGDRPEVPRAAFDRLKNRMQRWKGEEMNENWYLQYRLAVERNKTDRIRANEARKARLAAPREVGIQGKSAKMIVARHEPAPLRLYRRWLVALGRRMVDWGHSLECRFGSPAMGDCLSERM